MLALLHIVVVLAPAAAVEVVTRSGPMQSHIDVPRVGEIVG